MTTIKPTQRDRDAAHEWIRQQTVGLQMMMNKPRGLYEAFARHAAAERAIGYRMGIEAGAAFLERETQYWPDPAFGSLLAYVRNIRALSDNAEAIAGGE